MTKQISPKDWQTLSEYLDGQLSNRERVQIEARLQTSAELRGGLDELKHTRAILRTLPKRRAPRNFILTPAMVPQRRISPPRAFPYLRLASALASVLLVITFLSDLAVHNATSFATSSSNAPAVQAPAAANQSAPNPYPQPNAAAPAATTLPAAPLLAPASTDTPAAPQAPAAAALAATQTPAATEAPAAPPNPAAAVQATEAPTSQVMRSMAAGEARTEDETQQASVAMTQAPLGLGAGPNPAATAVPGGGSSEATAAAPKHFAQTLQSPTPESAQDLAPRTQAYPAPDTFAPAAPGPSQKVNPSAEAPQTLPSENPPFEIASLLRPAEILFAIIAVLTGLAAYIVYRAGRT